MTSDYLDGVFCDGQALYLLQWNHSDAVHVTKVRLSDMKVANQWPINQATTDVISGCYDDANDVFWLGSLYSGTIHRYLGSGLDLRDDPSRCTRSPPPPPTWTTRTTGSASCRST